jgi:predicted molibdopterin-dependent oxidoreductase YjgC
MGYNRPLFREMAQSVQVAKPTVDLTVNGCLVSVPSGSSVAAALLQAGIALRASVSGEPRGPLCAMGICMECCAMVNGTPQVRTCQVVVEDGMEVVTG